MLREEKMDPLFFKFWKISLNLTTLKAEKIKSFLEKSDVLKSVLIIRYKLQHKWKHCDYF